MKPNIRSSPSILVTLFMKHIKFWCVYLHKSSKWVRFLLIWYMLSVVCEFMCAFNLQLSRSFVYWIMVTCFKWRFVKNNHLGVRLILISHWYCCWGIILNPPKLVRYLTINSNDVSSTCFSLMLFFFLNKIHKSLCLLMDLWRNSHCLAMRQYWFVCSSYD